MDLKDKKILLTGASGGIGSTLALALEKEGAELFLVSFSKKDSTFLKASLEKKHKHYSVDLTDISELKKLVSDLKKDTSDLDILINNAGVGIYNSLEKITEEDWFYALNLNLNAPFWLSKYLIDILNKKEGLVLNMGSGAGVIPMANRVSYCTTKFGLRGMSLSLAQEYDSTGIDFVLVTLGSVLTSFGGVSLEEKKKKENVNEAYLKEEVVIEELIKIMKSDSRKPEYELYPLDYWPLSAKKQTHLLFRELLRELDDLDWPRESYAITSSGALAIRGLRRAHDLDIVVTHKFWDALSEKHEVLNEPYPHIQIGNIEVFGPEHSFSPPLPPVEEQISTADIIDGHRFVALPLVEQMKKILHRGKDYKDIDDIERVIKETHANSHDPVSSIV